MTEVKPETQGPYEARVCKDMPADCCDYGVVSLSEGIEVCRVWREQDARAIAALLAPPEQLLTAYVSRDCKVVGIDHQTEANWSDVRQAHIVLRDWLNERLEHQDLCPLRPAPHTFTANGPGVLGSDNCQICERFNNEPETDVCRDAGGNDEQ